MPPLTPGVELTGRYQLHRQVSDDGLIETWTATDQVLARAVEVEILRPDTGTNERNAFLASASAVARLSHPGIVNAYDTGLSADGMPFLVMERSLGPTVPLVPLFFLPLLVAAAFVPRWAIFLMVIKPGS